MRTFHRAHGLVMLLLLLGAAQAGAQTTDPGSVLVVANANSPQSIALADYYMGRRAIPAENKLLLDWSASDTAESCDLPTYNLKIADPICERLAQLPGIDYIVLCRNLPYRILRSTVAIRGVVLGPNSVAGAAASVDSALSAGRASVARNPYFGAADAFSSARYGIYLVTRLDGATWGDAFKLVDRSIMAAPGGVIFFDLDPEKDNYPVYKVFNDAMGRALNAVADAGQAALVDSTSAFADPAPALAVYVGWGASDSGFSSTRYANFAFTPGSIAEMGCPTSAASLRSESASTGQINVLIRNGVTGVKGYLGGTPSLASADPELLMRSYLGGRNLAESFYGASRFVGGYDVVIGDPLCRTYVVP